VRGGRHSGGDGVNDDVDSSAVFVESSPVGDWLYDLRRRRGVRLASAGLSTSFKLPRLIVSSEGDDTASIDWEVEKERPNLYFSSLSIDDTGRLEEHRFNNIGRCEIIVRVVSASLFFDPSILVIAAPGRERRNAF